MGARDPPTRSIEIHLFLLTEGKNQRKSPILQGLRVQHLSTVHFVDNRDGYFP